MPKPSTAKSPPKIVYPSGVKEINEDLSTDDLVRRLKDCAQAFQNMSQDDDNSIYIPLALYLGSDFFLEHPRKDVRLIIACSIADVFRVFAPEAPYKDPEQLKVIFEFFIQQLRGLEDPKDPIFKRYFYLLEVIFEFFIQQLRGLEDPKDPIFKRYFYLLENIYSFIYSDNHSTKVKNFMMDMMCPLISEADSVSQELLDIILAQIIEPRKTQNKNAYNLAKDILRRTCSTIEPYLQAFFNNALILGKTSRSDVGHHLYDLIYELNSICPSMLVAVLPQLEFKLKSNEEKERLEVSRLLARMFSDKNSDLAAQNKPLWNCFLGRYNDISVQVRMRCVQYSMHFLLNHPELSQDITEQLRHRQHDPEETVRYEVVMAIISAAKKDFSSISEELLNFVKERTLDKKFKIRKEALLGLAMLYKQNMSNPELPESTLNCISWIKNKVLHGYYQSSLEDRLLVERILYTCLVPYQSKDRMKKLYQLFATVDDNAVKAFNELLKCQNIVRNQLCNIIETLRQPKSDEREKNLCGKIVIISKNLSEPIKSQEYIRKFCTLVESNQQLHTHVNVILKGSAACSEVEHSVKEILKAVGPPVQMNSFYMTIKQLLERVAPVMIDHSGIKQLIFYVKNSLLNNGEIDKELGLYNSAHRGLQLLHTLSFVYPGSFHGEEIFNELLNFFYANNERAAELTLQILTNIGESIEKKYPNVAQRLLPLLKNFVQNGSVKQAKYAVACINTAVSNKEKIFGEILEHLKQHLSLSSGYFRTALVSVGHIAFRCSDLFGPQIKSIVSKVIVKELLMMDLVIFLLYVNRCLWFLMEPLMTKNENYSFSFFKRLIENIKQTKDKQASDDDLANLKLYAVCDLALGLVISKTTNFVLKDFPVEPSLPSKLFTSLDKSYSNVKTYLPQELAFTPPKKSGIEMEMFGLTSKGTNRTAILHTKKEGKTLLNGETVNKELAEEENDSKNEKENKAVKEATKQTINDGLISSKQLVKRSPGRPRKFQIAEGTKLSSKSTTLANNSSASTVKRPRGRPPGKKNSNNKKKDENDYKKVVSGDETKDQTDDNNSVKNQLSLQQKLNYLEDKNINSNNFTDSNQSSVSASSKKLSPTKRPRGRPKKLFSNTSELCNETLSSTTDDNSISPLHNERPQRKRKLSNSSKLSSNDDSFEVDISNKHETTTTTTTSTQKTSSENLYNDNLSNSSIYYDVSPKKLSIIVDKVATDRYCKLNIKEPETHLCEDRLKNVNNSNKKSEKPSQEESTSIKPFLSPNGNNNRQTILSNSSSPEVNKVLQSTPMTRTARKSFVDKRYTLKSTSQYTAENKSPKYNVGKGKTLSPTIISVCASPEKSPVLPTSKVPSSESFQSNSEDKLLNTSNIKTHLFHCSLEKLRYIEHNETSLEDISLNNNNKSKKKLSTSSNTTQKENAFTKNLQTLDNSFKASSIFIIRDM
ncbi:sister chromatid cohesion protein PDS5 homolog B-like [Centruroides sculpturatus]|uniref:sister chromatid cohesion protein PDS5 homolog B-like n=1 Tax=Centruroides sculpturatus TaxID=218467 RepID=UPI000C6D4C1E|nr:sister chromatid cohesion protein PDS5 homolog B-like [Centruroides sculpturatus]